MNTLTVAPAITAMSPASIDNVRRLESFLLAGEIGTAFPVETQHLLHGGQYSRTICLAANMMITGALMKIPTTLVLHGDVTMYTEDGLVELHGHHVLSASAGRKQAFLAHSEVHLTMTFPTTAQTVAEAEREMTDEWAQLASGRPGTINHIEITGVTPCQQL